MQPIHIAKPFFSYFLSMINNIIPSSSSLIYANPRSIISIINIHPYSSEIMFHPQHQLTKVTG